VRKNTHRIVMPRIIHGRCRGIRFRGSIACISLASHARARAHVPQRAGVWAAGLGIVPDGARECRTVTVAAIGSSSARAELALADGASAGGGG
jgi:hypothetical protein